MDKKNFLLVDEAVRFTHKRFKIYGGGHDFYHALRVAKTAHGITMDEWSDDGVAQLAALAGLCHNADRVLQKKLCIDINAVPDDEVKKLVFFWLSSADLSFTDRQEIIAAVMHHENKNDEQDSRVLIALADADRVVNLELDLVIRAGQCYHNIPAVDFDHFLDDPEATFREPRSVLREIAYMLEWMDEKSPFHIRTSLGRKLGKERATALQDFVNTLKGQLQETGLLQHPEK